VTIVELGSKILRVAADTFHPGLLTLSLVSRQIEADSFIIQQIRFVLFFVEEPAPQQIFSVFEVFGVEL
jgi:hypothetical protein